MQITMDVDLGEGVANPKQTAKIERQYNEAVEDATEFGLLLIAGDLKKYPRQRSGTKYRRTKTLGRSWHHKNHGATDRVLGEVVSSGQIAPYNRYVQSDRFQARQHRRLWNKKTDVYVTTKHRPKIHQEYTNKVVKVFK